MSQLLGAGEALFATPVMLKLHDGIEGVNSKADGTLVDKIDPSPGSPHQTLAAS